MQYLVLLAATVLVAGCTNNGAYTLSRATEHIIAQQILDPDAPQRNDGITRELQGDYAKHAAENYRDSIYAGKEGRTVQSDGNGK